MEKSPKVIAIVPAFNEAANIVSAVEDLRVNAPDINYVVVNDGSRDETAVICRQRGYHMVDLPVNLGLAGAFQTGMKYALDHGYDYALQFDADGQHSAAYVGALVDAAEKQRANVVIGSRFAAVKKPVSARMAGSALISAMILLTTGKRVQDPTSGMRLFDASMIRLLATEPDLGPEPDTIALLMRRGAKVCEVQVQMRDRVAGESYLTFTRSASYMARIGLSILLVQWFRRPFSEPGRFRGKAAVAPSDVAACCVPVPADQVLRPCEVEGGRALSGSSAASTKGAGAVEEEALR
uniref:Glycosyltransferase family 2 protein n=1 Tax=Muribaculaceae bacterium Z82 TaxID=2304548 RepID=A0A7C9N9P2_9BACT